MNKEWKYHSMCEMVESAHAVIETQRRIFIKYQYIPLAKPMNGLEYENVSWIIFGDGCVGHKCMDTMVARPTT
jgi:hypothetical protein